MVRLSIHSDPSQISQFPNWDSFSFKLRYNIWRNSIFWVSVLTFVRTLIKYCWSFISKLNSTIETILPDEKVPWNRHGKTGESGRVRFGSKRVRGQNESFLNGSIGLRVKQVAGCESGRVDPYFSKFFFFVFEVDAICQLFISSLTIIRFSLVILLPITSKHLTWYPNLVQLLFQLSRN